jgi:hypothetical protein
MKIEKEKKISFLMIDLYYKKHKDKSVDEKEELKKYVELRLNKCPFKENKTFCSNCKIHCYKKDMQEKIRRVMRYSGPRMLLYHPILAIKHLIESKREKKNGKK